MSGPAAVDDTAADELEKKETTVAQILGALDMGLHQVDWDAVRQTPEKDVIRVEPASARAGGVFERDIILNFTPLLHFFLAFGLSFPSCTLMKEAFLEINKARGLVVPGAVREADGSDFKPKSKRVLKKEAADWAGMQAGRLRSLATLVHKMTRKTPVARCEEVQALKDLVTTLPGFKPLYALPYEHEAAATAAQDDAGIGEAIQVPGHTRSFSEPELDEDIETQQEPSTDEVFEAFAQFLADGDEDENEDEILADGDEHKNAEEVANGEAGEMNAKEAAVRSGAEAAALAEDSQAAQPQPPVPVEKLASEPLLPPGAVQLQQQLADMGEDAAAADILFQQTALKAQARQEKAAKLVAKGKGKGRGGKKQSRGEGSKGEKGPEEESVALPGEENDEDEKPPPPATDDLGPPAKEHPAPPTDDLGPPAKEHPAPSTDAVGPPVKKQKKAQAKLVGDLMPDFNPLAQIGLVLPTAEQQKQKNYTMQRPGMCSIAVQKGSMYYVTWVSLDPWVRQIAALHGLNVNSSGAAQITFLKFGIDYGFRLAMILGGWVTKADIPQPIPDGNDKEKIPEMIRKVVFPRV